MTRKRFIKLLMAKGTQRNDAQMIAWLVRVNGWAVQSMGSLRDPLWNEMKIMEGEKKNEQ